MLSPLSSLTTVAQEEDESCYYEKIYSSLDLGIKELLAAWLVDIFSSTEITFPDTKMNN